MATEASVTVRIATKEAGTAFVNRGSQRIMAMVAATRTSITTKGRPLRKTSSPVADSVLKLASCARPITMASPLTKPSMTECGTMRISFPSRPNAYRDLHESTQDDRREEVLDAMLGN